jgi:hypothetical protein
MEEKLNYTIDDLFQKLKESNIINDSQKKSLMRDLETIGKYTNDSGLYWCLKYKIEEWKNELHNK